MKKIIGFKNKGRTILKKEIGIQDKQLRKLLGRDGLIKLDYMLKKDIRDIKRNKLVTYTTEEVLGEIDEIIDKAILEQRNGIY